MRPALGSVLASVLVALILGAALGLATANAATPAPSLVAAPTHDGGDIPTWPFAVGTVAAVAVVALWAARRGR